MSIKVYLNPGDYTSFSGVQFTDVYLEKTICIFNYCSGNTRVITSTEIQSELFNRFGYQKSDIRTLFSLLKKLGFISTERSSFIAKNLFTLEGELFVHIIKIKLNMSSTSASFKNAINNAFSLIVQKGFVFAYKNKNKSELDIPECFWLLIDLLKVLGEISGTEYLYAISCEKKGVSINDIATNIHTNRAKNINYECINLKTSNPIANTAYIYNFGLLKQAKIIEENGGYVKLTTDIFK